MKIKSSDIREMTDDILNAIKGSSCIKIKKKNQAYLLIKQSLEKSIRLIEHVADFDMKTPTPLSTMMVAAFLQPTWEEYRDFCVARGLASIDIEDETVYKMQHAKMLKENYTEQLS